MMTRWCRWFDLIIAFVAVLNCFLLFVVEDDDEVMKVPVWFGLVIVFFFSLLSRMVTIGCRCLSPALFHSLLGTRQQPTISNVMKCSRNWESPNLDLAFKVFREGYP